jgi:uncharacterized membrane protein
LAERSTVAGAAIFTAFVFVATATFSAGIPATQGYFNVGEIMVYTTALLMGPYVGAFAGGVGSMLSDVFLGFPQFAPGTLVIKAAEGYIVGYLGNRALSKISTRTWKGITIALGFGVALIISYVGASYWSGDYQLAIGAPPYTPQLSWSFAFSAQYWGLLALLVLVGTIAAGLSIERRVGWLALSVLTGGAEMVTGYFLYETLVLGQIGASAEIPFNIAQAVIGLIVALPLVRSIRRIARSRVIAASSLPAEVRSP